MNYIEIRIDTSEYGVEAVVAALLNIGITDTVVEDPHDIEELMDKKQTYDWDYIDDTVLELMKETPRVTVYFEDTEENRKRADEVRSAMRELKAQAEAGAFGEDADLGTLEVGYRIENDAGWKDKWKEFFKPSQISAHIVVKPSWEPYENRDGFKVIEIDPGMAFGTGTHETTSLCVKMLESYMKPQDHVLDVGCGSGILSIAAAVLGAEEALGIDIDQTAVEVAEENIRLNGVGHIARAQYGDLTRGLSYEADIIVANLMADLVMMLADDAAKHLKKGGKFISSGILTEKQAQVCRVLQEKGYSIDEIRTDGEWCAVCASIREQRQKMETGG